MTNINILLNFREIWKKCNIFQDVLHVRQTLLNCQTDTFIFIHFYTCFILISAPKNDHFRENFEVKVAQLLMVRARSIKLGKNMLMYILKLDEKPYGPFGPTWYSKDRVPSRIFQKLQKSHKISISKLIRYHILWPIWMKLGM